MTFQPQFPGMFSPAERIRQPATEKQIAYAERIAKSLGHQLPQNLLSDRAGLSAWIDARKTPRPAGRFSHYPSSKQIAFAERLARITRREIPRACFRDKVMMSKWIDGHRPR
ncbi:MAG: hypothetical protein AB8B58_14805 [Roseobacter sp.]